MVQNEEREHVPQISVMLKIIGEKGFDLFSDHPFESEPWRNGLNSCRSWICEAFSGRWHWSCSMWFLWYITLILLVWYDIWNPPPGVLSISQNNGDSWMSFHVRVFLTSFHHVSPSILGNTNFLKGFTHIHSIHIVGQGGFESLIHVVIVSDSQLCQLITSQRRVGWQLTAN